MVKDYKEIIEHAAVIWALAAITPFIDIQDIFLISLLKDLFGISYALMAVIYFGTAIAVLVLLAPQKIKKLYYKIKKYF